MTGLTCWVSIVSAVVALAVNGPVSSHADQIPATKSSINAPTAIAVDSSGHLYVIEGQEDRVDRIDFKPWNDFRRSWLWKEIRNGLRSSGRYPGD
jgi:hypothetical protein